METLTPDAKYALAEKLSGGDLIRLCSTDTNMRKICQSSRYNSIWQQKLKDEFNIDYKGNNGYMMYLQSIYFYDRTYWLVSSVDRDVLFRTHKEALNHIVTFSPYPAPVTLARLEADGEIAYDGRIVLRAVHFEKDKDYVKAYNDKLMEIANMIGADYPEDFINDFDITLEDNIDNYVEKIRDIVSYYFKESNTDEEAQEKVEDMLVDLLNNKYYLQY